MDYTDGSYIIMAGKEWNCAYCNHTIRLKEYHFARVKEYGESLPKQDGSTYRQKEFTRYHINCARQLYEQLTEEEIHIIAKFLDSHKTKEKFLLTSCRNFLDKQERKGNLTYIRLFVGKATFENGNEHFIGKLGSSDLLIFPKNGKGIFVETKQVKGKLLNSQLRFKKMVESLGYEYHKITSLSDLYYILNINN